MLLCLCRHAAVWSARARHWQSSRPPTWATQAPTCLTWFPAQMQCWQSMALQVCLPECHADLVAWPPGAAFSPALAAFHLARLTPAALQAPGPPARAVPQAAPSCGPGCIWTLGRATRTRCITWSSAHGRILVRGGGSCSSVAYALPCNIGWTALRSPPACRRLARCHHPRWQHAAQQQPHRQPSVWLLCGAFHPRPGCHRVVHRAAPRTLRLPSGGSKTGGALAGIPPSCSEPASPLTRSRTPSRHPRAGHCWGQCRPQQTATVRGVVLWLALLHYMHESHRSVTAGHSSCAQPPPHTHTPAAPAAGCLWRTGRWAATELQSCPLKAVLETVPRFVC